MDRTGVYGLFFAHDRSAARNGQKRTPVYSLKVMMASVRSRNLIWLAVSGAALLWAFWSTLAVMADKWSTDPQYSHGFLVPAFAAFMLWHRRRMLPESLPQPNRWGLALIGFGIALHLAGAYVYFDALSMVALLPVLAGLCLCYCGWPGLRWAWPSVCFLVFMLPLPHRVEVSLSHPLQRLATYISTYTLQTVGFAAVSEGNVIILDNARFGVVEACNGLGMLVTFFAMTTATVLVVRRPPVETSLIFVSAIPIALIANVIRITATAVFTVEIGSEVAGVRFHDLAGWLMMPLALGLLWVEMRMLALILLEPEPDAVPVLGLGVPQPLGLAVQASRRTGAKLA
jgi:exosortase